MSRPAPGRPRAPGGRSCRPDWRSSSAVASADAPRRLVRPVVGERVEDVGDGHDPPGDRDRLPGQAGRVAAAVPALVVGDRDLLRHPDERERAPGEHLRADRGVGLHVLVLVVGQLAALGEHRVGDGDLADVVQGRGELDELELRVGQPEALGDLDRQVADPMRVPAGVVVVELGGRGEAGEHLELRLLELARGAARVGDVLDLGEELHDPLPVVADRGDRDARLDHAPAGAQVASLEAPRAGRRRSTARPARPRSRAGRRDGRARRTGRPTSSSAVLPVIRQTAWLTRSIRPSGDVMTLPIGASSNATRSRWASPSSALGARAARCLRP